MKKIYILFILVLLSINFIFSQKVIEMTYENGIYTIPCKVNGIPMKFIFDTGASDVSISLIEAKFLLKQGLLNEKDVKGKVRYKIANGEIEKGTKIILREINIDGIILNNIEASIVHELNAPLLLGQSAISKLGAFKLDGNKLIITNNKNNYYTFLNIDLTKTYSDFGFLQSAIKQNSINGYKPVEMSQINTDEHFLSYLKLKERVVFDLKGEISFIILADKFENLNNFQKEKTAKEKFKNLTNEISKKYGKPNLSSERVSEWKSLYFDILISLNINNELMMMYVPYVAYNNPINNIIETTSIEKDEPEKQLTKKEFEQQQIKNFREVLISTTKYILNGGEFDDNSFKGGVYENEHFKEIIFPRIENDNLVIYFDREYKKISPSRNGNMIYTTENKLINGFCYDAFLRYFGIGKSSIEVINYCELNNIIFRFDIIYADESSRTILKTIKLKRHKLNLKFPYTKREFIRLLK